MDDKRLYFIALLPPAELSEKISVIKNNFAKEYNCQHALKVLPHITIQKPFKRSPVSEVEMHLNLQYLFESFEPFEIQLKGYGCFDKGANKVIFIHVEESNYLLELHDKLMLHLRDELRFSTNETPLSFHPHITIAYRDLSSESFSKAWPKYKDLPFDSCFHVNRGYLLKHNFRQWEVLSEFNFKKR